MKAEAPIGCRGEVPRLGTGLPSIVGAGFILPAGVCVAAGSAGRCKHRPLQRFAARQGCRFPVGRGPSVDRRGGIYPARGRLRRRGVPGPIWNRPLQRFAIPQKARFPGWYGPSVDRRGGIYPARGCLPRRGVRRDEGIPPYGRLGGYSRSGLAGHFGRFVGEGFIPPGPCAAAGSRDDASIVPYRGLRCDKVAVSRLGTAFR